MDPEREIVITGLGVVSPIGIGRDAYWAALQAGTSGVAPIRSFDARAMPVSFGAELKGFDAKQYVKPRKAMKVMCRELQTAFSAAALAAEDAGLQPGQMDPDRLGVIFGSEMFYGEVEDFADLYRACLVDGEFCYGRYAAEFPTRMYPLWMLKNLPNMAACHVAIALDARGPNNTIVSGDVSGLLAIAEAVRIIRRGAADAMLVGGTGSRVGITGWMYRGDVDLSHRSDDPQGASRPFDAERDGMVNGEGAGAILLETRQHAERRGAVGLARLAGIGTTMATQRNGAGFRLAIEQALHAALASAAMEPAELGHVNAHGLSTIKCDRAEARAIAAVLGKVPVVGLKSYFGHLGTGSSIVELIGTVLALEHDLIPPTRNFATPDPECPVNVIHGQPLSGQRPAAMKLAFSGMGQTAAIVLRK